MTTTDALGRPFPSDEHRSRYLALQAWREAGVDPFGQRFSSEAQADEITRQFDLWEGKSVRLAGRVTAKRGQGKAAFLDLRDRSGRIQLYATVDQLGEESHERLLKWVHVGDFLGVEGTVFRTNRGEISIRATAVIPLSKALSPMPEKWHGLQDVEIRFRKRYLDLISNPEVKQLFLKRSAIVRAIREFLWKRDYVEVEIPVLTDVASGAAARPFNTHHNALDWDLHLRISLELPLKKAMIGGIERVFEIGRVFRNEGIDRDHSPEFTMLECYEAYSDYEGMMELTEQLFYQVAMQVNGTPIVPLDGAKKVDLTPPWPRARYTDLLAAKTGVVLTPDTSLAELKARIRHFGLDDRDVFTRGRAIDVLFSKTVEDDLLGPIFIRDYPIEISPLAKRIPDEPHLTYRFEAFINGMEMGNAFSELNDPEDQRRRFMQQAEEKAGGDEEAMPIDEDFIEAMEHGMPPAGGLGIGIDRLVMVLAAAPSLREIILFPLLKEKEEGEAMPITERAQLTLMQTIEKGMAAKAVSPGKLMKELNISKPDFNGWRKGERIPTTDQLKEIAEFLHIPLDHLVALEQAAQIELAHLRAGTVADPGSNESDKA